jgi:ribonuclease BN (tRNA processing enzyme)
MLLGTGGGPVVGGERGMTSSAVVVDDAVYVVDCGYGASAALTRQGSALRQVEGIFITHNHADHLLDYGSILFFAWLHGRSAPITVYGPPPLER